MVQQLIENRCSFPLTKNQLTTSTTFKVTYLQHFLYANLLSKFYSLSLLGLQSKPRFQQGLWCAALLPWKNLGDDRITKHEVYPKFISKMQIHRSKCLRMSIKVPSLQYKHNTRWCSRESKMAAYQDVVAAHQDWPVSHVLLSILACFLFFNAVICIFRRNCNTALHSKYRSSAMNYTRVNFMLISICTVTCLDRSIFDSFSERSCSCIIL